MKAEIYTNIHKDSDLRVTKALLDALKLRGVECRLDRALEGKLACDGYFDITGSSNADFMLSVGGDGTILRVAEYCALNDIPVAGVNLGYMGFLTEEEPAAADALLDAIIEGKYTLERRALLSVTAQGKTFRALNDAVTARDSGARMLEIEAYVNGEFVDFYRCDGYIVSTPTGSTAYSLSAGGPILSPGVAAFILTPLNSHSLHSRPIVVSDEDEIVLRTDKKSAVSLIVDGERVLGLGGGAEIELKKSDRCVSFVRLKKNGFYNKLLTKLNKWSITEREE